MEIATLKDLKEALKNIPDNVLKLFGAGINPEGDLQESYIELIVYDQEDPVFLYNRYTKQFPILEDISKWIKAISIEQERASKDDDTIYERTKPISSKEI